MNIFLTGGQKKASKKKKLFKKGVERQNGKKTLPGGQERTKRKKHAVYLSPKVYFLKERLGGQQKLRMIPIRNRKKKPWDKGENVLKVSVNRSQKKRRKVGAGWFFTQKKGGVILGVAHRGRVGWSIWGGTLTTKEGV